VHDPRVDAFADVLIRHSLALQPGEKVFLESFDMPPAVVAVLTRRIAEAGGLPFVETRHNAVLRELYRHGSEEQMRLTGGLELTRMREMDCYLGLRGAENSTELSDVPAERMRLYQQHWWTPVHIEERCNHTRWVVMRWPTASMAQSAGMSTEAFEDFYFRVCTMDYAAMARAVEPLAERLRRANTVRLTAPATDTDLRFSIEGIPVIPCVGHRNIPDGECFTAPVRDSVEGRIGFNAVSVYQGKVFENIRFAFRKGRIVEATSSDTEALNTILDVDAGARYVGEFSLGFNPYILHPMRDTLFDEKIAGSLHFTPGNAYEEADNGNRSQVHWDLVLIQRPEYGGGDVYLDDELIRRDGEFLPEDLQPLNRANFE